MYNVDKIFSLLKERKLRQLDLAQAIGVSQGNIADWKKGKAKPSANVIPKIADYFKLPLSDFYVYDTDMSTPPNEKDPSNDIEKSEEFIELEKIAMELEPDEIKVLIAAARALNAKQEK